MLPKELGGRIVTRAKRSLFLLSDFMAVLAFLANGKHPKEGLTILSYHRLARGIPRYPSHNPYNVEPDLFAEHVAALAELHEVKIVSLKKIAEWGRNGPFPAKGSYLLLTFDDGWRHWLDAAGLLADRGISAAFFVSTRYLGWNHLPFSGFDRWCQQRSDADPAWYTPLGLQDCRRLIALGMSVQSHGHSHRSLGQLSPAAMEEEVRLSLGVIRSLGEEPFAFSYPYGSSFLGDVSDTLQRCLRHEGVMIALSTDAGSNSLPEAQRRLLRLRRIPINDYDTRLFFQAKASGYCGPLPALKWLLHSVKRGLASVRRTWGRPAFADAGARDLTRT